MAQSDDHFYAWVTHCTQALSIHPIPGDASARQYFRVISAQNSLIAVRVPLSAENIVGFNAIASEFANLGLHVPHIYHVEESRGYLIMSDLGNTQLFRALSAATVDHYYAKAMKSLTKLYHCQSIPNWQLPLFDHTLLSQELQRFHEWYLQKHLGISLTPGEMTMLQSVYDTLIKDFIAQPQICVHRDYHCRNLMVLPNDELGLLDFQDAVMGPIVYDLVSLLRDCYVEWPAQDVYRWVDQYWQLITQESQLQFSQTQFVQWFDWVGLQRHLKVLGIFARLYRRDNKPSYLNDIPRILGYVLYICGKYPEFMSLYDFLQTRVMTHESNDTGGRQGQSTAASHG